MPHIEAVSPTATPAVSRAKSPLLRIKFVYYGPSGAGKTATLRRLAARLSPGCGDRLLLLDSPGEPTLYFDQLSLSLPIAGERLILNLVSVPGGAVHRPMRRLLLRGADAVILVSRPSQSPSSPTSPIQNRAASRDELLENLRDSMLQATTLPIIAQPSPFDCADDDRLVQALRGALSAVWPTLEPQIAAGLPEHAGMAGGLAACDAALGRLLRCGRTSQHGGWGPNEGRQSAAALAALLTTPAPPASPSSDGVTGV
jgi:hypothetical protein